MTDDRKSDSGRSKSSEGGWKGDKGDEGETGDVGDDDAVGSSPAEACLTMLFFLSMAERSKET